MFQGGSRQVWEKAEEAKVPIYRRLGAAARSLPPKSASAIVNHVALHMSLQLEGAKQGVCDHPEDRKEWRRLSLWLKA